jgi:hypothetical protein
MTPGTQVRAIFVFAFLMALTTARAAEIPPASATNSVKTNQYWTVEDPA